MLPFDAVLKFELNFFWPQEHPVETEWKNKSNGVRSNHFLKCDNAKCL